MSVDVRTAPAPVAGPAGPAGPGLPTAFTDPESLAVVGASADPTKWGHWLAAGALTGRERRAVWLVNRAGGTVLGAPCHPSVSALPGVPDLVVVCVPPAHVVPVVAEAVERGTRAFLTITAGLDEHEAELARVLRESGARMIGPNSLGMYDAGAELQLAWGHFTPGPLAIVSQSGQLGSELAYLGARNGVGVSRFCSIGNQLDVTAADVLESLVDDDRTEVVAVYLESFAGGTRIRAAMHALRRAGKHVLVLATGGSEGSRRLARSHTGSMTSAHDVVDAACRSAGAVRVTSPGELVDVARLLTTTGSLPTGRRVAVISDSGGQGGIAADLAAAAGLSTPSFSERLQERLRSVLPRGAATDNPVDLAGAGEADLGVYAELAELVAASGEVDAVVLSGYLGRYGEDSPVVAPAELAVVDRLGEVSAHHRLPVLLHTMSAASEAVARMGECGLPAYATVDATLGSLARAVTLHEHPGRTVETLAPRGAAPTGGYWAARALLASYGIALPPAVRLTDDTDDTDETGAADACAGLAEPLVLKAAWLEHKSEHGGIRTGLGLDELPGALAEMRGRLGPGDYVVEEQDTRRDVVELLVGARRDPDLGPTISVGLGGVEAELWRDVRLELAPVDLDTAHAMLDRLRCRPLLDGWRGRAPTDVAALAEVVVAVSRALAEHPELAELEVNPVRLAADGALAVDALVVPAPQHDPTHPEENENR